MRAAVVAHAVITAAIVAVTSDDGIEVVVFNTAEVVVMRVVVTFIVMF